MSVVLICITVKAFTNINKIKFYFHYKFSAIMTSNVTGYGPSNSRLIFNLLNNLKAGGTVRSAHMRSICLQVTPPEVSFILIRHKAWLYKRENCLISIVFCSMLS